MQDREYGAARFGASGRVSRRTLIGQACAYVALAGCASTSGLSTGANADLVVLSIGIGYERTPNRIPTLPNAVRDSRLIGDAFRRIRGADVTTLAETHYDVDAPASAANDAVDIVDFATFQRATDAFIATSAGKTAVLYYAGHGVQLNGENYLVLGDGKTLLPILPFLEHVSERSASTVVFFDACRDNPFSGAPAADATLEVRSSRSGANALFGHPEIVSITEAAGGGDGLARLSRGVGEGSLVVFATQAGLVALDGVDNTSVNSPFARAIARRIGERRHVNGVIGAIQSDVLKETNGSQNPVSENALGGAPLFLAGRPIVPS